MALIGTEQVNVLRARRQQAGRHLTRSPPRRRTSLTWQLAADPPGLLQTRRSIGWDNRRHWYNGRHRVDWGSPDQQPPPARAHGDAARWFGMAVSSMCVRYNEHAETSGNSNLVMHAR